MLLWPSVLYVARQYRERGIKENISLFTFSSAYHTLILNTQIWGFNKATPMKRLLNFRYVF